MGRKLTEATLKQDTEMELKVTSEKNLLIR